MGMWKRRLWMKNIQNNDVENLTEDDDDDGTYM